MYGHSGFFHNENNMHYSATTMKDDTMSSTTTQKWTMNERDSNAKVTLMQMNKITRKNRMKANQFMNEEYLYIQKNQMNWKESFNVNEYTKADYSCTISVITYQK